MWISLLFLAVLGLLSWLTWRRDQQAKTLAVAAVGSSKHTVRTFDYLDGLRGIAALVVVINHCLFVFYPVLLELYKGTGLHNRFELSVPFSPFNWLFSGSFAVTIFFVLSGFVLSAAYFKSRKTEIVIKGVLKRYIRLVVPVSVLSLLSYALMSNHLFFNTVAAPLTGSGWFASQFLSHPTVPSFVRETFINIFLKKIDSEYNFVLWTMHVEFIGSFIVFGLLLLLGRLPWRSVGYAALAAFLIWKNHGIYAAFIAGVALCDLYFNQVKVLQLPRPASMGFLMLALFLGNIPIGFSDDPQLFAHTWYQPLLAVQPLLPHSGSRDILMLWMILGSIAMLVAVLSSRTLRAFFSHKVAVWLGRISFMLYLVHGLVLFSLGAWLFTLFPTGNLLQYNLVACGCSLVVIAVSLGVAAALTPVVDDTAIWLSTRFANGCMSFLMKEPFFARKKALCGSREIGFN